jgi:hypothetical protein
MFNFTVTFLQTCACARCRFCPCRPVFTFPCVPPQTGWCWPVSDLAGLPWSRQESLGELGLSLTVLCKVAAAFSCRVPTSSCEQGKMMVLYSDRVTHLPRWCQQLCWRINGFGFFHIDLFWSSHPEIDGWHAILLFHRKCTCILNQHIHFIVNFCNDACQGSALLHPNKIQE